MIYILIAALWIVYGAFSLVQDKTTWESDGSKFFAHVIFAPFILIYKALYGIFKEYHN